MRVVSIVNLSVLIEKCELSLEKTGEKHYFVQLLNNLVLLNKKSLHHVVTF